MNFKFAKTLLVSSALTMGAFSLVACGGGEKSPSAPKEGGDASIILDDNAKSAAASALVKFTASYGFNTENLEPEDTYAFDAIAFEVYNSSKKSINVKPRYTEPTLPSEKITLQGMGVSVDLTDEGFAQQCGEFYLVVKLTGNVNGKKKTANQFIAFNRAKDAFCTDDQPEIPTVNEIEMVTYEVKMSTNGLKGLNLTTGTASAADDADVIIKTKKGGVSMTSGNGVTFSPIINADDSNYEDDYEVGSWPETENNRNAYVSDFKFRDISKVAVDIVESGTPSLDIFVAKTSAYNEATGEGFFAIAAISATEQLNGDFDVTLKVYKKK